MITVAALVVFFVAGCKKNPELPEDPYVPVYDQGSGTNEDPWLISNAEQLDSIRNNLSAHYRLIADIDLGDYLADKKEIRKAADALYRRGFSWDEIQKAISRYENAGQDEAD